MWRMSRALSSREFDLLLFPTVYSYVPSFGRARKLIMVHDIIAETYPQLTVPRPAARLLWKAKAALGRMQASAIITVSEYSRNGIIEHFGLPPESVFVVGEAADPVFRRVESPAPGPKLQALGLSAARRMIVYLGGFSPHKNLEALVAAFARLSAQPEFADAVLVMAGETSRDAFHTYFGVIAAQVERMGLGGRVVFTGFLPDEELVILLNLASLLVLPSLMEGFGLPAVEAAACGCPVIATKASPLPGLLGGGGIYIDPDEGSILAALQKVLSSPELRLEMSRSGLAAAQRLTWDHAARQIMDVIRAVTQPAGNGTRRPQ
jgi:glycosyltransferase involved in cell wall biosynthesis